MSRVVRLGLAAWAVLFMVLPSHADTIYLKTGSVMVTQIERFSDGAFWVKDGKRTVILHPDEITKIVFSAGPDPSVVTMVRPPVPPSGSRGLSGSMLAAPPAMASTFPGSSMTDTDFESTTPDTSEFVEPADLIILNYNAHLTRGIFQIIGEVENRRTTEARYVKATVFLMNVQGAVVDQNFSYVSPSPHLKPGERKSFKVSFLNPAENVSKYKIRVESAAF